MLQNREKFIEDVKEIISNDYPNSRYCAGPLSFGPIALDFRNLKINQKDVDKITEKLKKLGYVFFQISNISAYLTRESKETLDRIAIDFFDSQENFNKHLNFLKEAKKRDHRKIGKELDLFHFSKLVGPGLPLFTEKGTILRNILASKLWEIQKKYNWQKVWIPHIAKPDLYQKSGHLDKFSDDMFRVYGKNDNLFYLKPMNCPHHTQIFASTPKSYRDLPVKYFEETTVYRDEKPGELLGLTRVRSITQDDGHCFCTFEQIEQEIIEIITIIKEFYKFIGFSQDNFKLILSLSDKENPEKYFQDPLFNEAEKILEKILNKQKDLIFEKIKGEAAFYGPKIDFQFKDSLGRERQLSTIQLDFVLPQKFDLSYIESSGLKKSPIMIHRAICGSLERFIGILLEHYGGDLPFNLSPIQVQILPFNSECKVFAQEILQELENINIRAQINSKDVNINSKIKLTKEQKIPYLIIARPENIIRLQTYRKEGGYFTNDEEFTSKEDLISNFKIKIKNLSKPIL